MIGSPVPFGLTQADPIVSIVITNHNYDRFLPESIDSAVGQTYPRTEVIVVDDGSTDGSRAIIDSYGGTLRPLYQDQRGQTAAVNAGAAASQGKIVCFLDADDVLLPDVIERAVSRFSDQGVVNVHWPLWVIDGHGRRSGKVVPSGESPHEQARATINRRWVPSLVMPPTSGHAWHASFLGKVMPLPELERELGVGCAGPDTPLFLLAQTYGSTCRLPAPGGLYRVHASNASASLGVTARVDRVVAAYDRQFEVVAQHCRERGLEVDPERWRRRCDFHRTQRGTVAIRELVRPGERFILLDEDQWGHHFGNSEIVEGRFALPFLERQDRFWGLPADSQTAISELERMRAQGVRVLVIAWPAFWWLDFYRELGDHLRSSYQCLLNSEDMLVFDLTGQTRTGLALDRSR